ncbi:glycine cleavage H-protein [Anaeromyxobacter sp. K]|uniref:glycine cleavage system protein H n=1 Tax=Anaeromyxobacter sp. (strain K) TaxID=447217 RepID=UPI00015F90E5|nr:glycine cleavage system protein H [Anaeromyxobacter sp. K]ACG73101.1 glycine cleavage H-protein [Anaeromyxobacter sp. K]
MAYDLLSVYPAKLLEYGLGIAYLLMFIPFWRYVQGGKPAAAEVRAPARVPAVAPAAHPVAARPAVAGWFQVPAGVHLHPGHTWARLESDGLVAVGVDDFAHKLVGPARVELPSVGAKVAQGEPALELGDGERSVPMLSPIDGTVVAVNAAARERTDGVEDPYGAGWLFKVKAPRLAANLRQLFTDSAANRFLEDASERLAMRMSPELGRVLQDGGVPIHGIGRALAGDDWDEMARTFFLT